MLASYPDAEMGSLPMHRPGARLSATPARMRTAAPALGEHNAHYFGSLGVGGDELERLARQGVI